MKIYDIRGKVLNIVTDTDDPGSDVAMVNIDHEEIPGLIPARSEDFSTYKHVVNGLTVGDLVQGKLRAVYGGFTVTELNRL